MELTTKSRNNLADSEFALPGRRYPLNNKSHAANAKARASEMVNKGKLTMAEKAEIDRKANAKLKSKGK